MTLENDCINYVRKCHKCQIYADKIHVPPTSLNVMVSPWPFSMWGMDVIGPITPKASNGYRFIFVVIDYFTKWVEATSYASVTKLVVARFIKREIICRYGLPKRIISDNGLNLNNDMVTEVCTQFKIKHHNSVPYRSKMNGPVEAANKNVKKIIAKAIKNTKISTKSCLLLYMLIELGSNFDWGNSIFIGLWNGGCFAYRSENFIPTSTQKSRIRRS